MEPKKPHTLPPGFTQDDIFSLGGDDEEEKKSEEKEKAPASPYPEFNVRKDLRDTLEYRRDQYEDESTEDDKEEEATPETLPPLQSFDGYRALIRGICAKPDEDTPRLAFADWLTEHGRTDAERAWADWIRLDCADRAYTQNTPFAEQMTPAGMAYSRGIHEQREKIQHFMPEWLALLPQSPYITWDNFMRRGFVERVTLKELPAEEDAEALLKQILGAAPVTFLTVEKLEGNLLHALSTMREVRSLGAISAKFGSEPVGDENNGYGVLDFLYNIRKLTGLYLEGNNTPLQENEWNLLAEGGSTLKYLSIRGSFDRELDINVLRHLNTLENLTLAPYSIEFDMALAEEIRDDANFLPKIYHIDMGQGKAAGSYAFNAVIERYEQQGRPHMFRRG